MLHVAKEKNVRFKFLLASKSTSAYLEKEQTAQVQQHFPKAIKFFREVVRRDPTHFECRVTDQLLLDGSTCATLHLSVENGQPEEGDHGRFFAVQDINVAAGDAKAAFLLACTCGEGDGQGTGCMAHGLKGRTTTLFNSGDALGGLNPGALQKILLEHPEGSATRNNRPLNYLNLLPARFACICSNNMEHVPPPVCVQLQVSARCSTHCRMCQRHLLAGEEMTLDQWEPIIQELGEMGTKTVVFSGGEPLVRDDLPELLEATSVNGLKVGLLTNGTMPDDKPVSQVRSFYDAISEHAHWVAISIDGGLVEDPRIRGDRIRALTAFCTNLQRIKERLSATVTLQRENIDMDFGEVCRWVHKTLNIPKVNFKFATGGTPPLERQEYLLSTESIQEFVSFLWESPLPHQDGNNLAYLRRCFAENVFNIEDVHGGIPVSKLYMDNGFCCFTPLLFSLIHTDGRVFPCCHLMRDNHEMDPSTEVSRETHSMGSVLDGGFANVWHGDRYADLRRKLVEDVVAPGCRYAFEFYPCRECTRHFQHNRLLTALYREYDRDSGGWQEEADELCANIPNDLPVWF
jgi:MoaA/NifB/PqqE/SkfB family radical SAM enzyme